MVLGIVSSPWQPRSRETMTAESIPQAPSPLQQESGQEGSVLLSSIQGQLAAVPIGPWMSEEVARAGAGGS